MNQTKSYRQLRNKGYCFYCNMDRVIVSGKAEGKPCCNACNLAHWKKDHGIAVTKIPTQPTHPCYLCSKPTTISKTWWDTRGDVQEIHCCFEHQVQARKLAEAKENDVWHNRKRKRAQPVT